MTMNIFWKRYYSVCSYIQILKRVSVSELYFNGQQSLRLSTSFGGLPVPIIRSLKKNNK